MTALDADKKHEGEADDASRQVQKYIAFAASPDPNKPYARTRHETWLAYR
tara:strand:- start:102 stop:251 length:150 start_codon:yes stop_codon:yes gene_type:complete